MTPNIATKKVDKFGRDYVQQNWFKGLDGD